MNIKYIHFSYIFILSVFESFIIISSSITIHVDVFSTANVLYTFSEVRYTTSSHLFLNDCCSFKTLFI
ncbi:hypothetical protein HOF65_07690 [bacterium]|nr:hypothetical protein [bacterium]